MTYGSLAEVYDAFTYDFDYEAWADWYLKLITDRLPGAREICDVGCGTGSVTVPLARRGYRLTGVDLSGEMLQRAAEKARRNGLRIPFVCQDMRLLSLPHPVDAIICACDGVNYLTSPKDAEAFFRRAHQGLKPGGVLAFDISNEEKLTEMGRIGLFGEDLEDKAYLWQNRYDPEKRLIEMNLSFFVDRGDGLFERFCETHRQRAHRAEELVQLLDRAGFGDVRVNGGDSGESEGPGGKRAYFSAVKINDGV